MASTVSPPKPWERAGATNALSSSSPAIPSSGSTMSSTTPVDTSTTSTSSDSPSLPSRPSTLNSVVNRTASSYSPYGANRLGTSPYSSYGSSYGGYNSYSSPYSRYGGMGGMYGGYGGGMYGGMGTYGGMYGGMNGMPGDPNNPDSLTHSFNQSTQATFQIIESIVGAFGGFAQMLESTYMATHSSFFAMVSVAEQFGNLRNTLGSVLGIFTLMRWIRTLIAKLTGRPPPADATSLTPSAFAAFNGAPVPTTLPDGTPVPPRPSKKPFIVFLVTVVGLPYLMGKLIRALARSQEEEARRQAQLHPEQQVVIGPNGEPIPQGIPDPSKLDFCRVLYDYTPDSNSAGIDLAVKKGDLVAVLSRTDPMGQPSEWWRCRARDGQLGYLPSPYLEVVQRRPQAQITAGSSSQSGSRTQTMKSDGGSAEERTRSLKGVEGAPEIKGKVGDVSAESFQKSQFYS